MRLKCLIMEEVNIFPINYFKYIFGNCRYFAKGASIWYNINILFCSMFFLVYEVKNNINMGTWNYYLYNSYKLLIFYL